MVFVRTLFLKDTKMMYLAAENLEECRQQIQDSKGVPGDTLAFYHNGRKVTELQRLDNHATVDASLVLGLLGGKGGFGSMLRALGAQIEKTTNKEACRDLSGRRLRDINEETRLKNYVSNAADRERQKAEKKEAKLQKLRKIVDPKESGNGGKHDFHDPKYNKEREEATERVHEAMEMAFKSKTVTSSAVGNSSSSDDGGSEAKPGPSGIKRKSENVSVETSKPKKGLWVGDGLTESDLEDSSDEDDESKRN